MTTEKQQVHNLIILDESGSMESIKTTIISGFNELVQSIKGIQVQFPEQEHFISIVSFNSFGNKILNFMDSVSKLNTIDSSSYSPNATTPLFDAMGFSLTKLKNELQSKANFNVLVTILTDGEENASKEYSGTAIKKLIDELSEENWTFTYIGTDHDVEKMAANLSIKNTMSFDKNTVGITNMFDEEFKGRVRYSENLRSGINTKVNYFDESNESINAKVDKNENQPLISKLWERVTGKKINKKNK